ncbi:alpha/beta fold hydrolase [Thaumasiovibrio subtropicus]|uniref:alpha/beta fold hydrolase n=1 Tax=Thaumasiovibrio subtropicus TaxID=1891207 RepID=UPI000B34ACE3|nr:alpha/beta hydrolase [Thaumasiovibrio subtropicus]
MTMSIKGNGKPIIFLPGLFAGGWIWDDVSCHLAKIGYSTITFDQPIPDAFKGDIDYAIKMLEEAAALCEQKPIIAGNSMGALISLEFARRNPQAIESIIMSGAPGLEELETGVSLAEVRTGELKYAQILADRVFFDKSKVPVRGVEQIANLFSDRRIFVNIARWLAFSREYDVHGAFDQVSLPVKFIWGDHDLITPIEAWLKIFESHDNVELNIVENSGHSPMLERPEIFAHYISDVIHQEEEALVAC